MQVQNPIQVMAADQMPDHSIDSNTGCDLKTHDSYIMILVEVFTNHILEENTFQESYMGWAKYKIIMVLKPANMYQIIWQCHKLKNILIDNFQHHSFPY